MNIFHPSKIEVATPLLENSCMNDLLGSNSDLLTCSKFFCFEQRKFIGRMKLAFRTRRNSYTLRLEGRGSHFALGEVQKNFRVPINFRMGTKITEQTT